MKSAKVSKRTYLRIAIIVLTLVLIMSVVLFSVNLWESNQGGGFLPGGDSGQKIVNYNGQEYVFRDELETFLIMGLDKYEMTGNEDDFTNNMQADFLILFIFDKENESYSTIQINRDSMTKMNVLGVAGQSVGTVTKQIALAHTYGNGRTTSCRNTADAVSELLCGVEIDYYMSLTMDAVAILNDKVGGVEVTIAEDFVGVDPELTPGETVRLKGDQALRYVRTRMGLEDSSNAARMKRQQQYLQALHQQVQQSVKDSESFAVDAVLSISDYMVSNCTSTQLQRFFYAASDYQYKGISTIEGQSVVGEKFMEFYPNADSVRETVARLLCEPKR